MLILRPFRLTCAASSDMLTEVVPNTLIVGFGTVIVATFFALPLAWLLNRTALPLRRTFITMMAVVVIIPGFIKAMGWIMLINDRIGLLNKAVEALLGLERVPLTVVNNPYGIAWVMGLVLTPTMFFLISGPMRALDPTLEEAAVQQPCQRQGKEGSYNNCPEPHNQRVRNNLCKHVRAGNIGPVLECQPGFSR